MENNLHTSRHSLSHIMAKAVQELWPGTKLGIGPAIDNGFYYDFDSEHKFVPEDLKTIEAKMKEIIKSREKFVCESMSKDDAIKLFESRGEVYKVELVKELEDGTISIYRTGEFIDLCKGPHIEHTGLINNFKLTHIAGAYWKGDEKRPMLQRVYGLSFENKDALNAYIKQQEEAAKRDHRKLGTELDLFSINENVGPGLVLLHPKGGMLRKELEDWIKNENIKRGYDMVYSPHVARLHLWQISGHANFYSENMFQPIEVDEQKYQLKPMNCPFHIEIYRSHLRSYRDLPLRYSELGTVYRYERSGVVHGLFRVRGFTQDDAHIFCTPEQVGKEVEDCFNFALHIMKTFGFKNYSVELSVWDENKPENYTGTKEDWEKAQAALEAVLNANKVPYTVHAGEAAFYGPKIDIKVVDAIGRSWQLSTIQFDFNLPGKFDLEYVGNDGKRARPIMIHRAMFGSIERFMGVIIEHFAGLFPLWLAPVQVKVLTLTDNEIEYSKALVAKMKMAGIRAEIDCRSEKLGAKIREAHVQKVPYSIIVGSKEAAENKITLRLRSGTNMEGLEVDDFIKTLKEEVAAFSLENYYK